MRSRCRATSGTWQPVEVAQRERRPGEWARAEPVEHLAGPGSGRRPPPTGRRRAPTRRPAGATRAAPVRSAASGRRACAWRRRSATGSTRIGRARLADRVHEAAQERFGRAGSSARPAIHAASGPAGSRRASRQRIVIQLQQPERRVGRPHLAEVRHTLIVAWAAGPPTGQCRTFPDESAGFTARLMTVTGRITVAARLFGPLAADVYDVPDRPPGTALEVKGQPGITVGSELVCGPTGMSARSTAIRGYSIPIRRLGQRGRWRPYRVLSCGISRTTSAGSLSSRRPWNRGWRSSPAVVHSLKPTSATRRG